MNLYEKRQFALGIVRGSIAETGSNPIIHLWNRRLFDDWTKHVSFALTTLLDEDGKAHWNELVAEVDGSGSPLELWQRRSAIPIRRMVDFLSSTYLAFTSSAYDSTLSKDLRTIPTRDLVIQGNRVFIGHGHSTQWLLLKDFLKDRLCLEWEEFNRESIAGIPTVARLQEMLNNAGFAFIIMTAEDEHADGKKHARANVIHEAGLFQGRLGFERAIVLLEEGCEGFSNIAGLTHIRFPKDDILARSEEIREALIREGIIGRSAS